MTVEKEKLDREGINSKKQIETFEIIGYRYKGDAGLQGRLFFSKGKRDIRLVHLHMVEQKGKYWREHLLFRDYLRDNKDIAKSYLQLKRGLAVKFKEDRDSYTRHKSKFIQAVLEEAGKVL